MNTVTKVAAAAVITVAIGATVVSCSSQPDTVHVLQYGYYNPAHVWVSTPNTPYYVYVDRTEYNNHKSYYSTTSYASTYVKTHTVTTVNKGYSVSTDGKTTVKTTTIKSTTTNRSAGVSLNKTTISSSSKKR